MASPSIAIVVTFFGPVPVWLPAFLWSCRRNRDVRWLIYADFEVAFPVPENVTIKYTDLDELNARASHALGTRIHIDRKSLRKLCDLKPLYGLMFADDLEDFDWWAYSDLDIVWGDIRRFVTDDILREHDIISSRARKLSGHFTLFRNREAINRTFEIIPDVTAELTKPQYLRLDENVLTGHLRARRPSGPLNARPRVYWEQELTMSAAYQRALADDHTGNLWWRDGRTFNSEGKELMYLHFHKLKEHMRSIEFGFDDTPDAFIINRKGVFVPVETGRVGA
jgi:hypothetical protein